MRGDFIGRHQERADLEDAWASGRPELVVVHGRRRVGKSALLTRAGRPGGRSLHERAPLLAEHLDACQVAVRQCATF